MDALGPNPDLTVDASIAVLHRVFVTCSGCGRRNQLSYAELRPLGRRPWRAVFPAMRCRQGRETCGAAAARLEIIGGTPNRPEPVLTLFR